LLLPLPLAAWAFLHARRQVVRILLLGGAVAACLMFVLNPYLWPDPLGRTLAFVARSASRAEWAPIPTFYLGQRYSFVLPWHHSLLLTLVTVPLPILVLAGVGGLRVRERRLRGIVSLCLLEIGFHHLLMALPSSPGHDGVRLFLSQFTFVALLAGLGFAAVVAWVSERACRVASQRRVGAAALPALFGIAFLPPAVEIARAHPFELAYFNEVVGGPRGAYLRGFETTYWFDAATPGFLRDLERTLPRGARVWAYPAPWHFTALQRAGLLREDIVFTDALPAPFLLLMTRQGTFGPFEWRLHRFVSPILVQDYQGVPLLALYSWR